jgi:hypothetical protein
MPDLTSMPPQPINAATLASPPPRQPRGTSTKSGSAQFGGMTIADIEGGAALIGVSLGTLAGAGPGTSGPNVHVVLKASSRERALEVLKSTYDEVAANTESGPVLLHFSSADLMR